MGAWVLINETWYELIEFQLLVLSQPRRSAE